jgi:hypothetical protein
VKHRFLGFGLALALLASMGFAWSGSVQAIETTDVVVTGSVSDVLTISVNPGAVSFGTGLSFIGGYNYDGDVAHICNGIVPNGARYLGPNVTVTVQSSTAFVFGQGVQDFNTVDVALNRFHINTYGYDCGAAPSISLSGFFSDPIACPAPSICNVINPAAAAGTLVHTEHYALDVVAGDPAAVVNFAITYAAQATP